MTAAVLDRPRSLFADAAERRGGEPAAPGDRLTLEELLGSALHEARTNGSTECPVCHARMTARVPSTRAREAGGADGLRAREAIAAECGGCGSQLG